LTGAAKSEDDMIWLDDVPKDTVVKWTTSAHTDVYFSTTVAEIDEFIKKSGTKTTKQGHPDLEIRIVGKKRHAILGEAEETKKAQSAAGKDTMGRKTSKTDAISREIQAEAERLLTTGTPRHEVTGRLARRTWGEPVRKYGRAWIGKLRKRNLRPS